MDIYCYFFYTNMYSYASKEERDALHNMNANAKKCSSVCTGSVLHKVTVQGTGELQK